MERTENTNLLHSKLEQLFKQNTFLDLQVRQQAGLQDASLVKVTANTIKHEGVSTY